MIAVDWGSSTLRAFRLDECGVILDQRRANIGLLACQGKFQDILKQQVVGWDDELIVMAGMIGSRQGWVETTYVECPATISSIAAGMMRVEAPKFPDRSIWIIPGLLFRANTVDLLRGEETQLCALIASGSSGSRIACLPGTHCKWVMVNSGRIESFSTCMTGEVFALLRKHSLLAPVMLDNGESLDREAFTQGFARAREPGGVLHHLFGVRTAGLMNAVKPAQLSSYLSGLLIGHELLDSPWKYALRGQTVDLIGSPALLESYKWALDELGVPVEIHPETLSAHGIHALSKQRGLFHSLAL